MVNNAREECFTMATRSSTLAQSSSNCSKESMRVAKENEKHTPQKPRRPVPKHPWQSSADPLREESQSKPHAPRWRKRCRTVKMIHQLRHRSPVRRWPYIFPINTAHARHVVYFLPELSILILPLLLVFATEEAWLETQPVCHICTLLRHEVDFKSSCLENLERVKRFDDEKSCGVTLVERGGGGGDCNDGAAWERHLASSSMSSKAVEGLLEYDIEAQRQFHGSLIRYSKDARGRRQRIYGTYRPFSSPYRHTTANQRVKCLGHQWMQYLRKKITTAAVDPIILQYCQGHFCHQRLSSQQGIYRGEEDCRPHCTRFS
jgi:hypothetical protein